MLDGEFDTSAERSDHTWMRPRTTDGSSRPLHSIGGDHDEPGTPSDLTARVRHANGIEFHWTTNAADADGQLLEIRPDVEPTYRAVAFFQPEVDAAGLITMPDEKNATYRIRSFTYGGRSNTVVTTTGDDPG